MVEVKNLKGVGETTADLLKKLGLTTVEQIVENVPRRYDDFSHVINIRQMKPGTVTIKASFSSVKKRYSQKGLHITEALASDATGSVRVMWFNQPYRAASLKPEQEYYISGEFAQNYRYLVISNPACELVSSFPIHTARLVPQYKLTKGITSSTIRKVTKKALEFAKVPEILPKWVITQENIMPRAEAYTRLHFPDSLDSLVRARNRLGFDELFEMSLASELNRQSYRQQTAVHVSFQEEVVLETIKSLPYKLTDDQRKITWQIIKDMAEGSPMNRLVEGDVGSGKTMVATIAMLNVAAAGKQSVLMAPTEILGRQHANTILEVLPEKYKSSAVLLSGSMNKKQKEVAYKAISSGQAKIIIGTHAVLEDKVSFDDLALVVIDEQHRFGVDQRKKLQSKATTMPHVLNMSATPIPRSIALTLFGEMDISVISQMPKGRQQIETSIHIPETRQNLYEALAKELGAGRQAFVVCPIIEQTESKARSLSVSHIHSQVKKWLKDYKVEMLHGKMSSEDKQKIMNEFAQGTIDVLVSTTVIEVGVDVPNATHMIVEGADMFGLAQLHQLRGRVGRGEHKGYCWLIQIENGATNTRLKLLEQEASGFVLAEKDLELRGPGAIYGSFQHGALDLKIAKISDTELVSRARSAAVEFIKKGENLVQYPELKARVENLRKITNLN